MKPMLILTLSLALGASTASADTAAHGSNANAHGDAHTQGHGNAHGHGAGAVAMTGDAMLDIPALMKSQFDTPENPLTVAPITVQGNVAIAGWMQDGRGGRAFLRQDDKGWFIELCAGTALLDPATLTGLGLTAEEAETLVAATRAAEAEQGADVIGLLDSFDGLMVIGRGE
jgi:hypothetical protein